jgi:hypothetical protein
MGHLRLDDPIFDRPISLRDAYKVLEAFIVQYNARGESSTVALMTDVGVSEGGPSSDPAQIGDFVRVAAAILGDNELRAAVSGDIDG